MIQPRFLIDENLSVELANVARARGYEAAHVAHRGLRTWKDWSLLDLIAEEDWLLVTNNAMEFRSRMRRIELHPGVIFLIPSVPRANQIELFDCALDEVGRDPDLVNTALDVRYEGGDVVVRRYALP